jgi:hypothetical protein
MDMLEDYLRAVSRLLPPESLDGAKRDDIVAELRDEILTRVEARESELGRKLTEDETQQLLRDFGHPIVVASRYRDGAQYAVGPAFYPYWVLALRFIVVIEFLVAFIVLVARTLATGSVAQAFGQAVASGVSGAMTLIGFATVLAWLVERKTIHIDYLNNWRVRDLRFLDFAFFDWAHIGEWMGRMDTRRDKASADARYDYRDPYRAWALKHASAGRGIGMMVVGGVFILWWLGVISFGLAPVPVDFSVLHMDPGLLAHIDFPALKTVLYWPVLAYFTSLIALGALILVYPRGVRLRGLMDILIGLSTAAIAAWLWTLSPVGDAIRVASVQAFFERIAAFFTHPVPIPLVTVVMAVVVSTGIGGLFRAIGGLWELAFGIPRYPGDMP